MSQPNNHTNLLSVTNVNHNAEEDSFPELEQNQPFESQNQTQLSDPPQKPRKEKAPEHTKIDLAQMASRQVQLEGIVEETTQVVHTIKQLLERMLLLPAQQTPRLRSAVERMGSSNKSPRPLCVAMRS